MFVNPTKFKGDIMNDIGLLMVCISMFAFILFIVCDVIHEKIEYRKNIKKHGKKYADRLRIF